jgi:hypothetical protein
MVGRLNGKDVEGNGSDLAEGLFNFLGDTDEFYHGTESVMITNDWKKALLYM